VVLAQVLLVPVAAAMVLVIALAPRHLGWGWGVILMAAALVTCLTLRIARITRRKPIDELPHKPSQPLQKPPPGHARRLNTAAAVALMVLVGAALGMALLFAFGVAGMVAWYSHRRDTPQQFPIIGPAQIETTSADQLQGYSQGQWVSLFDGQSLAGWKAIPEQHWHVKDGLIHGSGPDAFLMTSAADFEDFHLLVEFRINEAGDSGVHFRIPTPSAESGPHWGYRVTGMEAEIGINKEPGHRTGALTVKDPEGRVLAEAPPPSHKADEWTRMEVIARRQRIQILVNGTPVTDYQDREQKFRKGHIALASWEHAGVKTAVEFRKVEVRSLTPAAEWKPLFNGTDLRGWTMHPESSSAWTVKDNLLVGLGPNQYLYSERGDYQDFILRAEAQINAAGDGGVLVRMAPPAQPPAAQSGYEVQLAADPNHVSPTATIIRHGASVTSKDAVPQSATGRGDLIQPDEWFSLELAVIGGHLSVAIDGRQVVSYRDEGLRANGYIALQSFAEGSELSFRKIEIQELSAEGGIVLSSDAAPPPALAPFDAAQAAFHRDAWAAHLDVPAEISNSLGMKFRLIPPGGFTMGSGAPEQQSALANMEQSLRRVDAGDEKGRVAYVEYLRPLVAAEGPAHRVTLTRPYYIGTTEVTAAQFGRFVHATGHVTSAERSADGGKVWGRVRHESSKEFHWRNPCRRPRTPEHPVTQVSHEDALAFCRWLSEKEGIEYDLPTEAQWEFACRAGSDTPWSFGSDPAEIDEHAWADMDIALSLTEFTFHEAGRKAANAFGLYDMHGNVQEWCKDWWSATAYSVRAEIDPTGPAAPDAESNRVVRGGAIFLPHDLRSAIRRRATADYAENGLGFRVVIVGNLQAIRPAAIAWGPVRDGWQVGLGWKEGKQRYAAGDKVEFELKVRNATDAEKTIRIVEPGHWDLWYSGDNDLSIRIFGRDEQDVKLAPREEKAIDVPKPQIDLAGLAGGTYRVKVTTDVGDAKHQPPDGDFGFQYDGPAEPPFAAPMDPLRHPDDQYAAIAWGRPVLGLSLGIREAERQDAAGEQTLEFFLWNAGSGPANIEYLEHHPLDWQLVLRDQDGQELESEPILTGPKVQANQQLAAGEVLPLGSTPLSRQWLSGRRPVGGLTGSYQAVTTFNCRRLDYGQLNLRLTSGEATAEMKP
jgi:formylglycine-generating enzyme required for sulfatase activity